MLGEGLNFAQYHCHKAIMFIDYRFNDKLLLPVFTVILFMQKYPVDLYLVYAESEGDIRILCRSGRSIVKWLLK